MTDPTIPTYRRVVSLIRQRRWELREPAVVLLRDTSIPPEKWGEWLVSLNDGAAYPVQGTTDPGRLPMEGTGRVPVNRGGVARIPEGFYPDFFYPGWHGAGGTNREHPCWRQCDGQAGTDALHIVVERWDGERWVPAAAAVGPFNYHRADWNGKAWRVGDYSHGCPVARDRFEHWNSLVFTGYPEHGPTPEQQARMRCSLYVIDITPRST